MATTTSYLEMAQRMPRAQFISTCGFPFLVGNGALVAPSGPRRTEALASAEEITKQLRETAEGDDEEQPDSAPLLLAVRKAQESFPSMITIGRTANNDLVIPDVSVSKFHAHIKTTPAGLELNDAGSKNGTWLGSRQLARGVPVLVAPSSRLRFGRVELTMVTAAQLWDDVRRQPDW